MPLYFIGITSYVNYVFTSASCKLGTNLLSHFESKHQLNIRVYWTNANTEYLYVYVVQYNYFYLFFPSVWIQNVFYLSIFQQFSNNPFHKNTQKERKRNIYFCQKSRKVRCKHVYDALIVNWHAAWEPQLLIIIIITHKTW